MVDCDTLPKRSMCPAHTPRLKSPHSSTDKNCSGAFNHSKICRRVGLAKALKIKSTSIIQTHIRKYKPNSAAAFNISYFFDLYKFLSNSTELGRLIMILQTLTYRPCFKLASINLSKSPSKTAPVFEVSPPVRKSLIRESSNT